jgi:MYXO-CTERM domain-containing protein
MLTKYRTVRTRRALIAALALAAAALSSTPAMAHFRLLTPGNWVMQSNDGSPQKTGPCGNEAPQNPSNVVTPFRPGDTITIQLDETVYHPGHYRVALAVNAPGELPPAPPVTAGNSACGSTVIQQNPAFPILADGMLQHSQPFATQQSFQVKLPTDVTCTACTLQIIEFMSSHAAPCFYYHCAKISIQGSPSDGGSGSTDASRDASGGAGGAADAGAPDGGGGSGATGGTGGSGAGGTTGGSAGTGATGGTGSGGSGAGGTTGGSGGAGTSGGVGGSGAMGGSAGTGGAAGMGTAGTMGGGASGEGGSGSSIETPSCSCSLARASARATGAWTLLALALVATGRRRRP